MRKTTLKPIPETKLILCCKQVKTTATIKNKTSENDYSTYSTE